jgi:hypothetical protein
MFHQTGKVFKSGLSKKSTPARKRRPDGRAVDYTIMIRRQIASHLLQALANTPVVLVNGARLAGESTSFKHMPSSNAGTASVFRADWRLDLDSRSTAAKKDVSQ